MELIYRSYNTQAEIEQKCMVYIRRYCIQIGPHLDLDQWPGPCF